MSFQAYPSYRPSGIAWSSTLPSHWSTRRLKTLFRLVHRPTADGDKIITAFRDGEVTLRERRREEGFTNALQEIGYQGVRAGDLVIHAMDGFAGAIGVSDANGKSTPVYSVCTPGPDADAHYFALLLRHMALSGFVTALARGVRERSTEFRWSDASVLELPCPPLAEQRAIVAFVHRETSKIDALVREQQRLIEMLKEEVVAYVSLGHAEAGAKYLRLCHAVDVVSRPVLQEPGQEYRPLGLYNRGRGLFHKEPRDTDEMGESSFFWIEPGDLIISGQFAWEGAVALAGEGEAGCVVSHRYPVVRGRAGVALTEYVFGLFLTRHGQFLLNEHSRGAAGRNRPLNLNALLKEKVFIPDPHQQEAVRKRIHALSTVRAEVAAQTALLQERRAFIISAAVTGKIDVRGMTAEQAKAA